LQLKSFGQVICVLAEILEYVLVVLAATFMVGFSFTTYSSYVFSIGRSTDKAAFSVLVTLAESAIEHGRSSARLVFDNARLTCENRTLTLASPLFNATASLPAECDFSTSTSSGERLVTFKYANGVLTMGAA